MNNRLLQLLGIGIVVVVMLAMFGWLFLTRAPNQEPVAQTETSSQSQVQPYTVPKDPIPVTEPVKPKLELSPKQLSLSAQQGKSSSATLIVLNAGGSWSGKVSLAGSNEFQLTGDCSKLESGQDCRLSVAYNPVAAGNASAELTFSDAQGIVARAELLGQAAIEPEPEQVTEQAIAPRPEGEFLMSRRVQGLGAPVSIFSGAGLETHAMGGRSKEPTRASDRTDDRFAMTTQADYGEKGKIQGTLPVPRQRIIAQGKHIHLIVQEGFLSIVPGSAINATVKKHVYGNDDRLVLIEAGSQIHGVAGSLPKGSPARVPISWNRIVKTDGTEFLLEAMPGSDEMGRQGAPAYRDQRTLERYQDAVITTLLDVGASALLERLAPRTVDSRTSGLGQTGGTGGGSLLVQSAQNGTSRFQTLSEQLLREGLALQPTDSIPQGTEMLLTLNRDLFLRNPNELQDQLNVGQPGGQPGDRGQSVPANPSINAPPSNVNSTPVSAGDNPFVVKGGRN